MAQSEATKYRNKLKRNDPEKYKELKELARVKSKEIRDKLKEDATKCHPDPKAVATVKLQREQAAARQQRRREKLRLINPAQPKKSPQSKNIKERNKLYKRKQRDNQSSQKKALIRKKDREQHRAAYHAHDNVQAPSEDYPVSEIKSEPICAVPEARQAFPEQSQQYASVLEKLTYKCTSRKSHHALLSTTATETTSPGDGATSTTDATDASKQTSPEVEALQGQMEKLVSDHQDETNALKEKVSDVNDRYKRSLAETENVRQRLKKQIDDAKLYGIQGFCKDLLEVADILNKATEMVPKEQFDSNPELKNLFDGLTMTEAQLNKVFTKNGLVKIDPPPGEKFNPNIHEALFQQPLSGDSLQGTVAAVTKIGYKLHTRTIRPALVGVFK